MKDNERKVISFFKPPVSNTTPEKDSLSLMDIYNYIRYDETAKRNTDLIRKIIADGGSPRDAKNRSLYHATFEGVFDYRSTNKADLDKMGRRGLITPSGYIIVDIDHVPELGQDLHELRDKLIHDHELGLRLLFVSPSGDGLKLVCKTLWEITDETSYSSQYCCLIGYLHERYNLPYKNRKAKTEGLDLDLKIDRTCYLCHDEDAFLNDNETFFNADSHLHTEEEIKTEIESMTQDEKKVQAPRFERVQTSDSYDMDYKTKLDNFRHDVLIPAMFANIPNLFPTMEFEWNKDKSGWYSPYKIDGSKPRNPRREKDKTIILQSTPYGMLENGEDSGGNGKGVGVIDCYMQHTGLDFREALHSLCSILGLTPPTPPQNENNRYNYRFKPMDEETINQTAKVAQNEEKEPKTDNMERYLRTMDLTTMKELAQSRKPGIKTPFKFDKGNNRSENLCLRPGTIAMIGAKSTHGKSKVLQNLALYLSRLCKEGESILYFVYEEPLLDILEQFSNIEIDRPLSNYKTSNIEQIDRYLKTGETAKIPQEARQEFTLGLNRLNGFIKEGKLRVICPDTDKVEELIQIVNYLSGHTQIRAVFVDYIQLLYTNETRKISRPEELKEVSKRLAKLADKLGVPFVVAAQLNRLTENPETMSEDNVADSSDLTRYANTILNLWNSRFPAKNYTGEHPAKLAKWGFNIGTPGKLYFRLEKNRGGTAKIDGVFDFHEETGKIVGNDYNEEPDQEIGFEEPESTQSGFSEVTEDMFIRQ